MVIMTVPSGPAARTERRLRRKSYGTSSSFFQAATSIALCFRIASSMGLEKPVWKEALR